MKHFRVLHKSRLYLLGILNISLYSHIEYFSIHFVSMKKEITNSSFPVIYLYRLTIDFRFFYSYLITITTNKVWLYYWIINIESGSGALIIYCQMACRRRSVRIAIVIQSTLHADYPIRKECRNSGRKVTCDWYIDDRALLPNKVEA